MEIVLISETSPHRWALRDLWTTVGTGHIDYKFRVDQDLGGYVVLIASCGYFWLMYLD